MSRLVAGTHACLIFESRDEQLAIALAYLRTGLARGERAVYICDESVTTEVDRRTHDWHAPPGTKGPAIVVLTKRDTYLRSGRFVPSAMVATLRETVDRARDDGFTGLCIAGDMTWALGAEPGCDRLIEYGAILNDVLPANHVAALCMYDRQRTPAPILHEVLRTHPFVVARGLVFEQNPFYEPPQSVLNGRSEADHVDWMLAQLERTRVRDDPDLATRQLGARLAAIVESTDDAILGKTLDGIVTSWNAGAARLYGYDADEMIGYPITKLLPPDRVGEPAEMTRRLVREERVAHYESKRRRKDGSIVDVSLTVSPIRDEHGTVIGASTIARDITQQKRTENPLREAEARYRGVVEQALVGVYIVEDDRFTYVNPRFADMFGYTVDEMLALPSVLDIVDEGDRERTIANMRARREDRGNFQYQIHGRRKDGTPIEVELYGTFLEGEPARLMGSTLDITDRVRVEEVARAASHYTRTLIEASLDPLVAVSPGGKITDVNTATEQATGVPRTELIGTDFADYFTDPDQARAGYTRVLADGTVRDYPLTIRHRSGRTIDVLYHATVYRNEAGELQGVFAAARDITERKRAEEALALSEARLRRVIDSNMVGMFFWDLNGEMFDINGAMLQMPGFDPAEPSPRLQWSDVTPPEHAAADERAVAELVAHGVCAPFEKEYLRRDGTRVPVMLAAAAFIDKPYTGVAFALDITPRKHAEEALTRLNAELEDCVAARTAALAAANRELEAFSYSVSHDLRAPLRALQGFSRILLDEHASLLPAVAARYIGLISDNAGQMGRLIDDLLAFSRLGRQAMRPVSVDMRALIADVLERLAAEREGRAIDVRVSALEGCHGDPSLLRQVFVNLISNAFKFTRSREAATVEIGCAPDLAKGDESVYFVRDNGVGFDMQYAGKLFCVFQRLHPIEQFEGTGVGLATVQRIVNRHGGRTWADAVADRGATFYVALPRSAS